MANNQLLASDNFTSGSLAAGWSLLNGATNTSAILVGTPNVAQPRNTTDTDGQVWTGLSWPNDQISECTISTLTAEAGSSIHLAVRWQQTSVSGYEIAINDGGVTLIRVDNGVTTTLGTVNGLTYTSGDVWALSAAGSCLTVFQNGNRLLTVGDATYTGGFPGFYSSSSVNVAHAQVSSWRGYSSVQQDGIWQKQGIVLAPTTSDLASSGIGIYEGCCIFDSNPQILTQFSSVYKLWFSVGPKTGSSVFYAESPDLKNWTRHSGAVIASVVTPGVIKNGSTYFLYCQSASLPGSGATQLYTSTDGINWTQFSASIFATGAYPLKPIAIVNGTWYALWGTLGTKGLSTVSLATAPDGKTWTASGSNPVISAQSTYPFPCVAQVGNTFYVWMQKGPSAPQNSAAADAFDPTECIRFSTTDFVHWSSPVISLHHSQMHEAVNVPVNNTQAVGGTAPIAIFNINNQANMLYFVSQGDNIGPAIAQVSLAIAPAPISSIVQFNEDAVQQSATDTFTEGTGTLPSVNPNWSNFSAVFTGTLKVVAGNLCEPNTTGLANCGCAYTGKTFSSSQYSEITVATAAVQHVITPLVLSNITNGNCYHAALSVLAGTQAFVAAITKIVGGSGFTLGPAVGITVNIGDVLRLAAVQTTVGPVISLYQNGSLITQVADTTSTALTSGSPGIYMQEASAGQTQISKWAGGSANQFPNFPSTLIDGMLNVIRQPLETLTQL